MNSRMAGILAEIGVDDVGGLGARDGEALAEAEGGDAVDDAEVHHLRGAAHVGGDVLRLDDEDLGGGDGVDVRVVLEGLDHGGVLRERGHHAELDLRVVAGEQA